ncbi:hypothetical protein FAM18175_02892 [Lacticaseibacillus paracasei]|nr:hypothetical protein FAM18175_02892 [Lacticaseibacillus paracasei]
MLDSIDLNNIPLFVDNSSVELSDTNLIYGKNGTGKSTMVKAISHQINDAEHCIIFDGMERFIRPDKKLNAILLGTQNLEIEKNINDLVTLRGKLQAQLNVAKKAYDTHQVVLMIQFNVIKILYGTMFIGIFSTIFQKIYAVGEEVKSHSQKSSNNLGQRN